jgi:hypothetical protein
LVHHQPLTDDDSPPSQDFCNPCFKGIRDISEWSNQNQNTNIYRSLNIWTDNSKREVLSGPFVIDIDGDKPNDSLTVTRKTTTCLFSLYDVKENDIKLFFTGHKGFNIEVLPSAIGLTGAPSEQRNKANYIRQEIIGKLRCNAGLVSHSGLSRNIVSCEGTVIDKIHHYVRLHESINEWIDNEGQKTRRKIGLTLSDLNNLQLVQIINRSIE